MSGNNANFNYYFYWDYYNERDNSKIKYIITEDNSYLENNIDSVRAQYFDLVILYPGLQMGLGYEHEKKDENLTDFIETGFSLDYVSGIPYLPGSSLKGMLRSVFSAKKISDIKSPNEEYIREILREILKPKNKDDDCKNLDDLDISALEKVLFETNDIYLDSYPLPDDINGANIMALDYISHHKNEYGDINVNTLMKIKAGIKFRFNFKLEDSIINGVTISAEQKCEFFKKIIVDIGVGARTNVGFGKFREE